MSALPEFFFPSYHKWLLKNLHAESLARFEKMIGKPVESGCIPWIGGLNPGGYGVFAMRRNRNGKPVLRTTPAPRAAWELLVGPIPRGLFVCHHCDNPPCINIDHLFLGTPLDNFNDMIAKGRHPYLKAMVAQ